MQQRRDEEKVEREAKDQELYDAFTELGSDPEASDIEFAFDAQAEVALGDWVQSFHDTPQQRDTRGD